MGSKTRATVALTVDVCSLGFVGILPETPVLWTAGGEAVSGFDSRSETLDDTVAGTDAPAAGAVLGGPVEGPGEVVESRRLGVGALGTSEKSGTTGGTESVGASSGGRPSRRRNSRI
jgi:hypothetical protein